MRPLALIRSARARLGDAQRARPATRSALRVSLYAALPLVVLMVGERVLGLSPSDPDALHRVASTTWQLGAMLVLVLAPARALLGILSGDDAFFERKLFSTVYDVLALLAVVLALRLGGAVFWRLRVFSPTELAVGLGALLAVTATFLLGARLRSARARRYTPNDEELALAAVHEAGHVLVWSLRHIPVRVSLGVDAGTLGRVEADPSVRAGAFQNAAYLRWRMATALAGLVAQELVRGEGTTGSERDHERWEGDARLYLASGFGDNYYSQPQNDAEVRHNAALLAALRNEHRARVWRFLDDNRARLEALAGALLERRELDQAALEPLVAGLSSEALRAFLGNEPPSEKPETTPASAAPQLV